MKEWLDKIRAPKTRKNIPDEIVNSVVIALFGLVLGILSKGLDNLAIDDSIWWQQIIGTIDLRNVFSMLPIWLLIALIISVYSRTPLRAGLNVFLFFAAMCTSYHLVTIYFSGFNPQSYMMIWYGLTLLSPVLAFICWYGKGQTIVSLIIDMFILGAMALKCFSFGFWYFSFHGVIDTIIFIASAIVLYTTPKKHGK